MRRRTCLAALGTAGASALAGCGTVRSETALSSPTVHADSERRKSLQFAADGEEIGSIGADGAVSDGRIELSTGQVIELTRSAIVGRNPRVEGTMHGEVPATIKIEGTQALSRSHAIIRLEGWQVMVEDLDSANGTTVTLEGRPPRRLRVGEPILVDHGALIDLGGEVTGTYDAFA